MAKRISKNDWASVEHYILAEMDKRERCEFRKKNEKIWKEVDRQVAMESMSRIPKNHRQDMDWRNAVELGELSRASEILSADIKRFSFPASRAWFEPHIELSQEALEQDPWLQRRADGRLRAFMTQQMVDFGFKSRVGLSVKEALHHGGYGVELEWNTAIQVEGGTGISTMAAPVWKPHSMWNTYPDLSAGIDGHNTFYQGSMIFKSWKPKYQVERMTYFDSRYPFFNLKEIPEGERPKGRQESEDVELITFYGDLVIPRQGKDLLLLNSRAILANGRIIHYAPNPFPFPPVIYNGWERLDVRDPYYVSPIVKFSVTQRIATQLTNRLLDVVDLQAEPPIDYDASDPNYRVNGGPDIYPGAKNATNLIGNYQPRQIGDPTPILAGVQFMIGQLEAGTKVDRLRSGVAPGTEQTATEVVKQDQRSEISTVDFVETHEMHGLRPAIYIMHEMNRQRLGMYPFYNQEMDSPDFERMTKNQLPKSVHFEIVGSKGVLGEERRQQQTSQVTAFWMSANPQMLKQQELAKEMFRDAGNKNPEKFLNIGDDAQVFQQQIQAIVQQAQQQIQALQEELAKYQFQDEEHSLEIEGKELEKEQLQTKIAVLQGLLRMDSAGRS